MRYYRNDDFDDDYFYSYRQMSGSEIQGKADRILDKHSDYEPVEVTARQGICSSWWGKSWCQNLERYADWSNRIERGKKYVRGGAVIDLKINGGNITARVIGSRAVPYTVNIKIKPLSIEHQQEVEKLASGKIQNIEELASGNFPEELKNAFFDEGILFPEPDEIDFSCNCPDSAYMCKHIAAVLYGIGVRLDSEPLYFFQMRGININKFIRNILGDKVERMFAKVEILDSPRTLEDTDVIEVFGLDMSDLPEIIEEEPDNEPEDEREHFDEDWAEEDSNESEEEYDKYEEDIEDIEREECKPVMKLPQFLKRVDQELSAISYEDLKVFAHEIARTYPEDSRERFLRLLTAKSKPKNDSLDALNRIRQALAEINNGERCLDSDYDEGAYDNYYDEDDSDDYNFYDPDDLLPEIEFAMNFVSNCIYSENYEEGYEIIQMLANLKVSVSGAYDDVRGEDLILADLFNYNIIGDEDDDSFDDFMNKALFLTYMNNELSKRAEAMYSMMTAFDYMELELEDLMQVGNTDLPEINEFVFLWINYLAGLKDESYVVKTLLLDAYSLLEDDEQKIQLAGKFAKKHPELYKRLLEGYTDYGVTQLKMGLQALSDIPISSYSSSSNSIRKDIALLTAQCALRNRDQNNAELCWLEAFKSEPTFVNYAILRFNSVDWTQFVSEEITKICKQNLSSTKLDYRYYSERDKQKDYRGILFFEGDFEFIIDDCMKVKSPMEWSSTFMKEAISLFLLLLFEKDKLTKSLTQMLDRVVKALGFSAEIYRSNTYMSDKNNTTSSNALFWDLFSMWKRMLNIADDTREEWLKWLEERIDFRTIGLLEAKRYNRYGECALFMAALGEVKESRGEKSSKLKMMMSYKDKYPTRKAFHRELDAYIKSY